MSEEKKVCSTCGCGGKEFYATQRCSGSITVVVDGDGNWLRNWCNDEYLVLDSLEYRKPEEIRELCTTCEDKEELLHPRSLPSERIQIVPGFDTNKNTEDE